MWESCFFNAAEVELSSEFLFQQDNASPHVSHYTTAYLKSHRISVFPWPPQSPDLSLIEDIWVIVSEKVYKHGKTYQTKDDLWEVIVAAWDAIPRSTLQNLYKSMNDRLIKVLESGGRRIRH